MRRRAVFIQRGGRAWRTEPREPGRKTFERIYQQTGDEQLAA
jgi:hypothetical protein